MATRDDYRYLFTIKKRSAKQRSAFVAFQINSLSVGAQSVDDVFVRGNKRRDQAGEDGKDDAERK